MPHPFDPLVPEKPKLSINWWLVVAAFLFIPPLFGLAGYYLDDLYLRQLSPEKQLPRIYRRIFRYARWMGHSSAPGNTPNTFTESLIQFMNQYGTGSREADWLLSGTDLLREITGAYYRVMYSPAQGSAVNSKITAGNFRLLRTKLWYLWILVRAYPYRITRFFLWDSAPMLISSRPIQSE